MEVESKAVNYARSGGFVVDILSKNRPTNKINHVVFLLIVTQQIHKQHEKKEKEKKKRRRTRRWTEARAHSFETHLRKETTA